MLKKNDFVSGAVIEGYTSEGMGVARVDGQAVFVRGALRGERCDIKILKAGKTAVYAKIEKIIERSEHRIEPVCPVYRACGGCSLMHMDYEEELAFKRERIESAFRRIGGLDLKLDRITGSDNCLGYRNKAIYNVSSREGRAVTGFYRPRSHDVVPVERCMIQADYSDRAAAAVRRWMDDNGVTAYDEQTHRGSIRRVFCRYGFKTGEGQVTVVSATSDIKNADGLVEGIRNACPETVSIVVNVNKTTGNTVLAGDFSVLWGKEQITDELCGLRFALSPRSFYQINRDQAERLYNTAVEYAGLNCSETVLDLYCGTGTITLCMARTAGRAVGAEIVEEAVYDAKKNAAENGVVNAEFICADAALAAESLREQGLRPDAVIVDPPRKGLDSSVIKTIAEMEPGRIVYVSCDPATLSRDLALFENLGYSAHHAEAFDLFPRTSHVETVVLITRAG